MKLHTPRQLGILALAAIAALGLSACSTDNNSTDNSTPGSEETREITDMAGDKVTVPAKPESVIATDNRVFGTLAEWGIELSAAPVDLMPKTSNLDVYRDDSATVNMGNHREPNFETVVAADPDLIINGQRFMDHADEMKKQAPEAAFVDSSFVAEDGDVDKNLIELTEMLGETFGKQDEADKLVKDFEESIDRAKAAYDSEDTVAGLITSGGTINYSAPTYGRAVGPVFDILDMTPAIETEGSSNHQGDDISVEAIASANPDWIIVLDRDAAVEEDPATAKELIEESEALKNVTAVKEDQIVYMAPEFYTAEDIQHYTELFNQLADAWEDN